MFGHKSPTTTARKIGTLVSLEEPTNPLCAVIIGVEEQLKWLEWASRALSAVGFYARWSLMLVDSAPSTFPPTSPLPRCRGEGESRSPHLPRLTARRLWRRPAAAPLLPCAAGRRCPKGG